MIHTENDDPAFRFEGLARAVFDNCEKFGDPFGIAAQETFNYFVPEPKLEGRKALSKIISKVITDHHDTQFKEELLGLEEDIWSAESQIDIIEIIDMGIDILRQMRN